MEKYNGIRVVYDHCAISPIGISLNTSYLVKATKTQITIIDDFEHEIEVTEDYLCAFFKPANGEWQELKMKK